MGKSGRAEGDQDVLISGGARTIQQLLSAGVVDQLDIQVVPLLLGDGERLFDNVATDAFELELVQAVDAPGVTHLRYVTR